MLLEDVAGNDQKEDVEVVRLVVPELDQAVVGQQCIVLLKRKSLITVACSHQ